MKTRKLRILWVLLTVVFFILPASQALAEKTIVLGCPLSTAFLYGWTAERGFKLAVDEINARGGVNVDGTKRMFEVEVIDTRDLEPGVPVSEALLAVEKLILDSKIERMGVISRDFVRDHFSSGTMFSSYQELINKS